MQVQHKVVVHIKGTIQRATRKFTHAHNIRILPYIYATYTRNDQSDCSKIMISLSEVLKLSRSHAAVGWYL